MMPATNYYNIKRLSHERCRVTDVNYYVYSAEDDHELSISAENTSSPDRGNAIIKQITWVI